MLLLKNNETYVIFYNNTHDIVLFYKINKITLKDKYLTL